MDANHNRYSTLHRSRSIQIEMNFKRCHRFLLGGLFQPAPACDSPSEPGNSSRSLRSYMLYCCRYADRLSRCGKEKLRRDRLNAYIGELAKIVPLVMQSSKKIDKASILRLTVTYLRIYHGNELPLLLA
jgi:Helix-loop-helix DNA-binding domain